MAPLACLVMVLLFARSGLYRDRPSGRASPRVISSLFQVTLVMLLYAVIEGAEFSSYYIFYGSLFFALLYVSSLRWLFERASGALLHAAGYRRRAVLVGSGSHIDAVAHALRDSSQVEPFGFVSLTPRRKLTVCATSGRSDDSSAHFDTFDEVLIADPDFPEEKAVDLVDRCHRSGVRVRVAPSTMEILMDRVEFVPGQSLPLFELKPPVFEGVDFVIKRDLRHRRVAAAAGRCSRRVLALIALAIRLDSRGPILFRAMRPGIGGKPFACMKFRTMHVGAENLQERMEEHNEAGGAHLQDPRRPACDPRRATCCGGGRWTSSPSCGTSCAATCRWWARARCPSATTTAWRTGTSSATWCCPG